MFSSSNVMHKIGFAVPTALTVLMYHLYIRVFSFKMQLRINYIGLTILSLAFYIVTPSLNNLQSGKVIWLTWLILCLIMYLCATTLVSSVL